MLLRKQFLEHIAQTSPSPMLVEVDRAEGVFFYTPEGRRYFDLIAGVSVSSVGHGNGAVVEAVQRQAGLYMHTMVYGELVQRPQVEYATLIAGMLPTPLDSIYFLSSGAEAVEGAMKLAKRYTGRGEILSMRRAYHGSTQGALSLMQGAEGDEWCDAFKPLLPQTRQIEFNSFEDLELITEQTACVITEVVQGEAGVILPREGYLEALRRRCTQMGALLIFDEIQTAMGRTGELFAMQRWGVTPDIVTLAKAFGGGMPLSAFVASKDIMSTLSHNPVLGHITTFGGHPVSCAAGLAALRFTLDNNLVSTVESKGELFEERLKGSTMVTEIRRAGLLMAVELGSSQRLYRLMEIFKEIGIMSDWFLYCDTAFRISPPLTITTSEISECCDLIIAALEQLSREGL